MTRQIDCSIDDLPKNLEQGAKDIEQRIHHILEDVAKYAIIPIRARVPVAFGELRGSISAVSGSEVATVVDAPHAAAVEVGSRPHTPDIDALIRWVKLRGKQGLGSRAQIRRMSGPTTASQARLVASQLRAREVAPNRKPKYLANGGLNPNKFGRHTPVDAADEVARAIAALIEKVGTKPHWYVRDSLPDIQKILQQQMRADLKN